MKVVAQRVSQAKVTVDGAVVGEIGPGLLLLVGVTHEDTERDAAWMADKAANLRIFEDDGGKMNLSLLDTGGAVLSVSQFTLYGDARKGRRPNFMAAAAPAHAEALYEQMNARLREMGVVVATGRFGAEMSVSLANDGPVTLILDSRQ